MQENEKKKKASYIFFLNSKIHVSWCDGVKVGSWDLNFSLIFESCSVSLGESFSLFGAQIFLLQNNTNSKHLYLRCVRHYSKPFVFDHLILPTTL